MKKTILALLVLAAAPLGADAQSYRCIGKDGKRHYGSTIPPECHGLPVEQLNAGGTVVKRIDPLAAERERIAKEATAAKKQREEAAERESARRNNALLATYTSEKDIEDARARALAENTKAVRDVEMRMEAARKRAQTGKDTKSEDEVTALEQVLEAKKREVSAINARYDEDKKRYVEISRKR